MNIRKYDTFETLQDAIDKVNRRFFKGNYVIDNEGKYHVLTETEYLDSPFSDEQVVYIR